MSLTLEPVGSVLLLHCSGAEGSTALTEETGRPVTVGGNAHLTTAQSPWAGGSSLSLDGAGDYAAIGGSVISLAADVDWTMEAWVYPTAQPSRGTLFSSVNSTSGPYFSTNAGKLAWYGGGATLLHQTPLALNTWSHVAAVRKSGVVRLFVNGVGSSSTTTIAGSVGTFSPAYVGASTATTEFFVGNLSDMHVVRGLALYTADFALPSAPPALIPMYSPPVAVQPGPAYAGDVVRYAPPLARPALLKFGVDLRDRLPRGVANAEFLNASRDLLLRPFEFKGPGRISGTVKVTPNSPVSRLLRLYREPGGLLVASTWSDAQGAYSFDNLALGYRYTVVSFDHTRLYRAVIADNLEAQLMP